MVGHRLLCRIIQRWIASTKARAAVRAVVIASLLPPVALMAQARVAIEGRVTSLAGAPIAGASVTVEGTAIRTSTRTDGSYRIEIPPSQPTATRATLTARAIGYKPAGVTVALDADARQDFHLEVNPLRLGEIVVTGSGTSTTTEKLGNKIDLVGGAVLARSNEQNLVNALAAKAPNVLIVSESGDPGASARIVIRGLKTMMGTGQPLFVVDGVPVDNSTVATTSDLIRGTSNPNRISDLNPDDIESISVLKGAAAGAIYGARAGQGVILITTKRGSAGGSRYTLRSSLTVDQATRAYPLQRKYGMGVGGVSTVCATPNCIVSGANAVSYGPEIAAGVPVFDHAREILRDGSQRDQSFSVSSGTERSQFYLSGAAFRQSGIFGGPNNRYDRTTARLNVSHQLNDHLRVGGNISVLDTRGGFIMRGSNASSVVAQALRTPADFNNRPYLDPVSGLHRCSRFPQPTATSSASSRGCDNPFFIVNEQSNTQNTVRSFGNTAVDWSPLPWLVVKSTLGIDFGAETRLQALPKTSAAFPAGQVISFQFNRSQIDHNLSATAEYTLTPWWSGTVVAGQNLNSRRYQQEFIQGNTLLAARPFKLSNTLQQVGANDLGALIHNEGYFAQGTADLYDQLYLTLAMRYDGSSTFSDNSRRNLFPKASAAWTVTEYLDRLGLARWTSYGKLRAAYGQVGQEPDPYQLLSTLVANGTFCDPIYGCTVSQNATQGSAGALFSAILKGQSGIKPERSTEFEVGLDLGLLGTLADLSVSYYNALSRDVLFAAPIANSTGFRTQVRNAGKIRNRGLELALNVRPVDRQSLGWELGLQWARNTNRVLSLGGAQFVAMTGGVNSFAFPAAVLGGSVGSMIGNDFVRCGRADVAPEAGRGMTLADVQTACAGARAGALVIAADGFPLGDLTSRTIGDPQPRWTAGVNSSLRVGKFRVTGFLDIRKGGQMLNGTKATLYGFGTHKDTQEGREGTKIFGETWMRGQSTVGPGAGNAVSLVCPTGTPACGTPAGNWFSVNGGGFGSMLRQFVEDAGFVKLREISVGYTLNDPLVRRWLRATTVDLLLAGRNLRTWTRYTGFDPEASLTGALTAASGADLQNTPQTRSYVFSVTLHW